MKKVNINFSMISLDSKVEFTTTGEYDNQLLKFKDNELSTHYIVFKGNIIEYSKVGLTDMKFFFDVNNKTKGIYTVDSISFEFNIITTKLENNHNKLIIKYDLIQDNEIVNRNTLIILYSITKEE